MTKGQIKIKTKEEIKIMAEGGKRLGKIKRELIKAVDERVSALDVEKLADRLIRKASGRASFKMVPRYRWATCINVNDGIVHGIPDEEIVFKKGDIVSVDVGFFYKDFHTDTSFTVGVKVDAEGEKFLGVGRKALEKAINKAQVGNRVFDISKAIQGTLREENLNPIRALVGHGIGRVLHEEPQIPCFITGKRKNSPRLPEGAVLAIEVMCTKGEPDVELGNDGWTIKTQDGKIAGLFEETVAVTKKGPIILTK